MTQRVDTIAAQPQEELRSGYRVVLRPSAQRIRVRFKGETVADSTGVIVMNETRLPAVFYFPRDDVRTDVLTRTSHRTHCPFKGNASYWDLRVGEEVAENAVWSYEDPYDEAEDVKDYVAFVWNAVRCMVCGRRSDRRATARCGAGKSQGSISESYASPCYGGGEAGPVIGAGGEADEVEPAQIVVQIAGGDAAAGAQEVLQPTVAAVHRLHM